MPATGRRLSFRARPLRAGAAPRIARAPCRAVDTPLICASQMRALRLPLGTWQRARRWLATDPTQTCRAGGPPVRRGGTRAARLPARGRGRAPPGCASAPPRGPRGRFLEAANSAWRASQEGRGRWGRAGFRCPASQEKRERGGRRRETAGRSTRQRGAGQAPGPRIPLGASLPRPPLSAPPAKSIPGPFCALTASPRPNH